MEKIEGPLRKMTLSAVEKKGVRGRDSGRRKESVVVSAPVYQAAAKLFSEKLAHPDSLEQALGRIWCPLKGLDCRSLGENKFVITFHQAEGKKKALEEGVWNLSKELLVLTDLDASKDFEELEFNHIPIWIQVSHLPLGMMNAETAEAIGDEVGIFFVADTDDGNSAVGRFLRLKVKIDVRKPLMRGVTVIVDDNGREKWCPIAYEHLPDFCYLCGILGHTDKGCVQTREKGMPMPYDRSLRALPPNSMLPWRSNSGGSGSRDSRSGSFGRSTDDRCNSSLSWWKDTSISEKNKKAGLGVGEEKEVTSPLKIPAAGGMVAR